jgi:transcriptional regulator with XRE-family HTH domain
VCFSWFQARIRFRRLFRLHPRGKRTTERRKHEKKGAEAPSGLLAGKQRTLRVQYEFTYFTNLVKEHKLLPIKNYVIGKLVQTIYMNLGAVIRQLRERRAWTQDELAQRAGTTAANISRIENGKHNPGAELLGSVAYVFGVRVYELMALAEGLQPPALIAEFDAEEEILVRQFRRMHAAEKDLLKAIATAFVRIGYPSASCPDASRKASGALLAGASSVDGD